MRSTTLGSSNSPKFSSPLLFALALDGNGGAEALDGLDSALRHAGPVWCHFDANVSGAQEEILKLVPEIDEHSLSAIFNEEARPRVLSVDKGTLIILRGINHNEGAEPEDMIGVRLWISKDRLVSLRYRKSRALMEVAGQLDQGRGGQSLGDVVSMICARLFSFIEHTISTLNEGLDEVEAQMLDNPQRQFREHISDIRKSAILLRRYIYPQKDAISDLRRLELEWLTKTHQRRLHESQDSLLRSIEELDAIRERAQIVKDELMNSLSDKLNRNLYLLSVITAIFLPLGFLTGLFGINIGGMPGINDEHAFGIFTTALAGVVLIQIVLFRLWRWF